MRHGNPWNLIRLRARSIQRLRILLPRKHLQHQIVGGVNVGGIAGKRRPAERPAAFAEQRTNVRGHESGKIVSVLHAVLEGEGANVVAVVEGDRAHLLQLEHAFDVARHGVERALDICFGIALAQRQRVFQRHAAGHIAVQRIVRRSLIGQDVGHHAALSQLGNDVAAIANQPDRDALLLAHRRPSGCAAPRRAS